MGTPVPLDFGVRSNPGEFGHDGGSRHINARVEDAGPEGKAQLIIKAVPGLKAFATVTGGGACRGLFPLGSTLYAISGNILVPVDISGTVGSQIGGIPGSGPLSFAQNRATPNEIALVSEGNKFILQNNALTTISDTDLPPPIHVVFVDGYFVYIIADGRFYLSGIDDGGVISSLDFATAEGSPDGLVGAGVRSRELFLIGEESTEVWQNTGAATFPFERLPGVFIEVGCAAQFTIRKFMGSLAWVTNRTDDWPYGVVVLDGYTPRRISTYAVERDIEDLADKSEMKAFTYNDNGHRSYALTTASWTWVFDGITGQWHERQSQSKTYWKGLWAAPFADKVIVGDAVTNALYELDRDTSDEAGEALIWKIRSPIQHAFPWGLRFNAFHADMLRGTGVNTSVPADVDPVAMLRYSEDGGFTWSSERQMDVGKIGKRMTQMKTRRLGMSRSPGRMWELSQSAAVQRAFMQASVDVDRLNP